MAGQQQPQPQFGGLVGDPGQLELLSCAGDPFPRVADLGTVAVVTIGWIERTCAGHLLHTGPDRVTRLLHADSLAQPASRNATTKS